MEKVCEDLFKDGSFDHDSIFYKMNSKDESDRPALESEKENEVVNDQGEVGSDKGFNDSPHLNNSPQIQ